MYRKIANYIEEYLTSNEDKILCIDGARQVGKTYIVNYFAGKEYTNSVYCNTIYILLHYQ